MGVWRGEEVYAGKTTQPLQMLKGNFPGPPTLWASEGFPGPELAFSQEETEAQTAKRLSQGHTGHPGPLSSHGLIHHRPLHRAWALTLAPILQPHTEPPIPTTGLQVMRDGVGCSQAQDGKGSLSLGASVHASLSCL